MKINVIMRQIIIILLTLCSFYPSHLYAEDKLFAEYLSTVNKEDMKKNINNVDENNVLLKGKSRMYWASVLDFHCILKDLLKDSELLERYGTEALIGGTQASKYLSVKILLEAGVNPDEGDEFGDTAFIIAALTGDRHLLHLLVEGGANVNVRNDQGLDAMISAIVENKLVSVVFLLKNEFDLTSSRTPSNLTPLELAKKLGRVDIVKVLQKEQLR